MRKLATLIVLMGIIIGAGCSTSYDITTSPDRTAQVVAYGSSPALAFQINAAYALGIPPGDPLPPLDVSLGSLGATNEMVLQIMVGGSIVNATMPVDVDVPEWDEWLLATTMDVDVPEWDEWLLYVPAPRYITILDEYGEPVTILLDVDVPEWDEWLLRFGSMTVYRPVDWMAWAVYGPIQIVDVDVPEWDEWLLNLTLGQIAESYNLWLIPLLVLDP